MRIEGLGRSGARGARAALAVAVLIGLSGCAGAVGATMLSAGTGVAMGTGVDYTLNGIAYKTFTAPLPDVRLATRQSLDRMGMKLVKDEQSENGWLLQASANQRAIDIELQKLTPRMTRMRVVANDGIFFKDRSTEGEIIDQTADALDDLTTRTKTAKLAR